MLVALALSVYSVSLIVILLICLLEPSVYEHVKPKTKKRVIELSCDGWLARKLLKNRWGATTIPLPFIVLILYWSNNSSSVHPHPKVRIHEFVHVAQDERNLCFLVSWWKYFFELFHERYLHGSWMQAYKYNKFEIEAYNVQGLDTSPDWAN
jgi:hypothetical protein